MPASQSLQRAEPREDPAEQPDPAALRQQIKALVEDLACAEGRLFFGEGSFTSYGETHSFGTRGPLESGRSYDFTPDFHWVRVTDAASGVDPAPIALRNLNTLRQLMVADLMKSLLDFNAARLDDMHPEHEGQFHILSGPDLAPDGTVNFRVDQPLGLEVQVGWDPESATLSYAYTGAQKPTTVPAGRSPSQVAAAFARVLGLTLPMFPLES
jgi:hypothetical protein